MQVMMTIGDLREKSVAKTLVENTAAKLGHIDTLINAAGVLLSGAVLESDLDDYDTLFNVNVRR